MSEPLTLRPRSGPENDLLLDHFAALRTIRSIRWVFFLLLILAMLVPVAVFWLAWNQVRPPPVDSTAAQSVSPESGSTAGSISVDEARWHRPAALALHLGLAAAIASIVLLALLYLLGLNVSLSGRLGGAHDAVSALVWMVLLGLLVLPWQHWLGLSESPQMFFSLDALLQHTRAHRLGEAAALGYYPRFLGLPLFGLLAAMVADRRFARSYRAALQRMNGVAGLP